MTTFVSLFSGVGGFDLGLAFDGDGDRVIAVDHLGRVIDGDRLIALARDRGVADDPTIRQRLAWCHAKVEIMRPISEFDRLVNGFSLL